MENRIIVIPVIALISMMFLILSQNVEASNFLLSVPNTLVAFWPADGNANDVTGHGHKGLLVGGVNYGQGITHQAFRFDGTSGSVNVGSLGINNTSAPFSITAWIKPNATSLNDGLSHAFVEEGTGINGFGNGHYFVDFSLDTALGPRTITLVIGSGQSFAAIEYTKPILVGDKWTFVTATYDGSKTLGGMKIYVNGILQNVQFTPSSTLVGSVIPRDQWSIGSQSSGTNYFHFFKGSIDDVKVFSCALSSNEVKAQFSGINIVKC